MAGGMLAPMALRFKTVSSVVVGAPLLPTHGFETAPPWACLRRSALSSTSPHQPVRLSLAHSLEAVASVEALGARIHLEHLQFDAAPQGAGLA